MQELSPGQARHIIHHRAGWTTCRQALQRFLGRLSVWPGHSGWPSLAMSEPHLQPVCLPLQTVLSTVMHGSRVLLWHPPPGALDLNLPTLQPGADMQRMGKHCTTVPPAHIAGTLVTSSRYSRKCSSPRRELCRRPGTHCPGPQLRLAAGPVQAALIIMPRDTVSPKSPAQRVLVTQHKDMTSYTI